MTTRKPENESAFHTVEITNSTESIAKAIEWQLAFHTLGMSPSVRIFGAWESEHGSGAVFYGETVCLGSYSETISYRGVCWVPCEDASIDVTGTKWTRKGSA